MRRSAARKGSIEVLVSASATIEQEKAFSGTGLRGVVGLLAERLQPRERFAGERFAATRNECSATDCR
jgi:hypothetical protein